MAATAIPALPANAFRLHRIATFPEGRAAATFFTTGTTSENRGVHEMQSTKLYDLACATSFRDLTPPRPKPPRFLSLVPSPWESPRSSLAHMVDRLAAQFSSGVVAYADQALSFLQAAVRDNEPVFIAATTVALWDLLRSLEDLRPRIALPEGSQCFETGGRKGRRFVPASHILAEMAQEHLGLPSESFLGEYGMTEMSSPSWGALHEGRMVYRAPAWAPVSVIDPESLNEVPIGEEGLIRVLDLANLGSVSALYTGDWGRRHSNGFEVLGRVVESEFRGCSIAVEPSTNTELQERESRTSVSLKKNSPPSLDQRIHSLGQLSDLWHRADHPPRREFEETLREASFFSPGSIANGLDATFAALDPSTLRSVGLEFASHGIEPNSKAIFVSAGNLPVTGVFDFFAALLAGVPSLHRLSRRGGDLLRRLHLDLERIDPQLADLSTIVETSSDDDAATRELFRSATVVAAQGDDATLEHLETLIPLRARFLRCPSQVSAAFLADPGRVTDDELDALIRDIFIWEQQGCRSPQILFSPEDDPLVQRLQRAASERARRWDRFPPRRSRGHLFWLERTANVAGDAGIRVHSSEHLQIVEIAQPRAEYFSIPGVIQWVAARDLAEVQRLLTPWEGQRGELATLPFGRLQAPTFQTIRLRSIFLPAEERSPS